VLPEHETEKVKELQRDGSRVAMIGDGQWAQASDDRSGSQLIVLSVERRSPDSRSAFFRLFLESVDLLG